MDHLAGHGEPAADQAHLAGGGADDRPADGLSPLERQILDTEGRWWRQTGSKETMVREELGLSGVRYYQILNHLLDQPEPWNTRR